MRSLLPFVITCFLSLPGASQSQPVHRTDRNASEWRGHQGEVSVAVDRYLPSRVAAGSMDLEDGRLLLMASSDEGESWGRVQIPLTEQSVFQADPMLAFDSEGRLHLAYIPVANGNRPVGIEVSHSEDGGRSWSIARRISDNLGQDDKLALAVDDERGSPFQDHVYLAWKWPSGGILFSRSLDRGASFSVPIRLSEDRVSGLDLAVSRDGTVYLVFHDHPRRSIRLLRSTDGGASFDVSGGSYEVAPVRAGWYTSQPSHCRRRSLVHASAAVDRSGRTPGRLYVTWSDYPEGTDPDACPDACGFSTPCQTDVYWSFSDDGGRSFAPPTLAHEAGLGLTDQYLQWLDVDPRDGAVYVAYKDSRSALVRLGADVYLSRSNDCGLSWESSVRLSSETSFAVTASFQFGDYQGVAVSDGQLYAAWSDYRYDEDGRSQPSEIFVGRALYPPSDSGWQVKRQGDAAIFTYRGNLHEEALASLYVTWSVAGEPAVYLTPGGTHREPTPYLTERLIPPAVTFSFPVTLASLPVRATLSAVLLDESEGPRAPERFLSSRLRTSREALVSSIPGCR